MDYIVNAESMCNPDYISKWRDHQVMSVDLQRLRGNLDSYVHKSLTNCTPTGLCMLDNQLDHYYVYAKEHIK